MTGAHKDRRIIPQSSLQDKVLQQKACDTLIEDQTTLRARKVALSTIPSVQTTTTYISRDMVLNKEPWEQPNSNKVGGIQNLRNQKYNTVTCACTSQCRRRRDPFFFDDAFFLYMDDLRQLFPRRPLREGRLRPWQPFILPQSIVGLGPDHSVGAQKSSDEGACAAWWRGFPKLALSVEKRQPRS